MRKSLKKKSVISIISLLLIAMSSSSLVFANEAYTVSKDGVVTETVSGMRANCLLYTSGELQWSGHHL